MNFYLVKQIFRLLKRLDFPDMKFSLYFMGYEVVHFTISLIPFIEINDSFALPFVSFCHMLIPVCICKMYVMLGIYDIHICLNRIQHQLQVIQLKEQFGPLVRRLQLN